MPHALSKKIPSIPQSPGIYKFLGENQEVLYVGKAKNLRARVRQYFSGADERSQIPYLLKEAADIDYTVVNSELESLYLENTLIKQYSPKYNIDLKDDKNYAFITIDYSSEIPAISYSRKFGVGQKSQILNPKSKIRYFGPYSAAYKIRQTLNTVRHVFPFCSANKVSSRPCFYYYLHRCPGVCIGKISRKEYTDHLKNIESFLNGNLSQIHKELKSQMREASEKKLFEKAARLRDQLKALEILEEKQAVILPSPKRIDVISYFAEDGFACINLFKIREGKMRDKENFIYELKSRLDTDPKEVLQTFCENYYMETSDAPKEIFLQKETENQPAIKQLLEDRFSLKVKLYVPQKSTGKELMSLGIKNAEEYLKNWLSAKAGHLDKINLALSELKEILNLEKLPKRIECFDISNIQGTNAVGSMVVFIDGLPAKSQYRKFKIKGKSTPDDFAMMKEMLGRRFARSDKLKATSEKELWPMPDLVVIDGGKGQLNVAVQTINNLQLTINLIGLAKRIEEIFLPEQNKPIVLPHSEPSLQLLQRLRDEAHRFGITFHRQLRSKQAVKSALDEIPGVGPKTKKLLKQKFGTVKNIRAATQEELANIVGQKLAKKIKTEI